MNKIVSFLIILFSSFSFLQNRNMPKNIEQEKCSIRCNVENENDIWRAIDCDLLTRNSELRVEINTEAKVLSQKNKKIVDKKIVKLIKRSLLF